MSNWAIYLYPVLVLVVLVVLYIGIAAFFSYRRRKFDEKPPSKRRPWRP
ncbi:hypothetical protein SAMN05421812_101709 [Asanoa hainanensis]|uniref:Uncharacterized protein n=1 Tax=Asanoa hainanensis TaxID=560556 RepID=A0A239H5Q6_9ACTN|nr:hypothetical protein [Asanoa hainanensis]SNS76710.1 hypothetical protein SAMN05421812_101709 [Asanoa hainanensis]